MKKAIFCLACLFLMIGVCFPQLSLAREKLALLDLEAEHRIDKNLAGNFSDKIRKELGKLGNYQVLNKRDMEAIFKKSRPECFDIPCLIDFGRTADVKFVISGSLSKLGSTYYVNLTRVDTDGGNPGDMKEVNEKYRCTEDELFTKAKNLAALIGRDKKIRPKAPVKAPPTVAQKKGPKTIVNTFGMSFTLIPTGTYKMGSPRDEPDRSDDEILHPVTISSPFYLLTTEVTQKQFELVMGKNPSHFKECGDECPAETVSWNDAQAFIKRLNEIENTDKYRLPTEAEWEYTARAGTATPFYTGDCISAEQANFDGKKPLDGCPNGVSREKTVKVKSFPPNAWGLYDMHGNVWEWCEDWKEPYPGDLQQADLTKGRVLRGGSFSDSARNLRSARRLKYDPDYGDWDIGFRIVKDL